jgi:hypothetical protein
MNDVIEVSYTGDILSHRRCGRAWAYEKHARFRQYEQVQAMEGRLTHHAMEWLTRFYQDQGLHADHVACYQQIDHHAKILAARGIRTTYASKETTLNRVIGNLFPKKSMHPTVQLVIEGAVHTEYELRSVMALPETGSHKSSLMLTGVLDLVVQSQRSLTYRRTWEWTEPSTLEGHLIKYVSRSQPNDIEIWDYKGSRADTPYLRDYVVQLLTYAKLFQERTGQLPQRCVLFFINEPQPDKQLIAVDVTPEMIKAATAWTVKQVTLLQETISTFEEQPLSVPAGEYDKRGEALENRVSSELKKQCTTCGRRFGCDPYKAYLTVHGGSGALNDIDRENVLKN